MIPEKYISSDNFRYNSVDPEFLVEGVDKFTKNFQIYKETAKTLFEKYSTDFRINTPMLYRILERIDQRKDYYLYFHSNHEYAMKMSQTKEIALFCYWLIKYKPIAFSKAYEEFNFFESYGYTVNEMYAAFLLMSFVMGLEEDNVKYFSEESIFTLTYSLSNREISKEALILYIESFLIEGVESHA